MPRLDVDTVHLSLMVHLSFWQPSLMPIFAGQIDGKRIRTNPETLANREVPDLSLLYHKGIRSRPWRSRTAQISRPSLGCWATIRQVSLWTLTPTLPPPQRRRRQTRWGISSLALSGSFRTFKGHWLAVSGRAVNCQPVWVKLWGWKRKHLVLLQILKRQSIILSLDSHVVQHYPTDKETQRREYELALFRTEYCGYHNRQLVQ